MKWSEFTKKFKEGVAKMDYEDTIKSQVMTTKIVLAGLLVSTGAYAYYGVKNQSWTWGTTGMVVMFLGLSAHQWYEIRRFKIKLQEIREEKEKYNKLNQPTNELEMMSK